MLKGNQSWKVGGYALFTQKNIFALFHVALFHVDVPGVFGAKVIRRIHTIIPKESFLFHVKVSVVNCAVRPLCLSAWSMYVPWTVKITYLFLIMFHLCLIGFYSRFIIFHWFVQCALHALIMFIHVFNCCVLIIFHLFVLVLICFLFFTSVRFWTECRIMFIDFSTVFLLRWKWGIQYAHLWSPPQLLTWTMAGENDFSITASMLMIARPILTFEDVLQTTTFF